jgi:hypothetical protein
MSAYGKAGKTAVKGLKKGIDKTIEEIWGNNLQKGPKKIMTRDFATADETAETIRKANQAEVEAGEFATGTAEGGKLHEQRLRGEEFATKDAEFQEWMQTESGVGPKARQVARDIVESKAFPKDPAEWTSIHRFADFMRKRDKEGVMLMKKELEKPGISQVSDPLPGGPGAREVKTPPPQLEMKRGKVIETDQASPLTSTLQKASKAEGLDLTTDEAHQVRVMYDKLMNEGQVDHPLVKAIRAGDINFLYKAKGIEPPRKLRATEDVVRGPLSPKLDMSSMPTGGPVDPQWLTDLGKKIGSTVGAAGSEGLDWLRRAASSRFSGAELTPDEKLAKELAAGGRAAMRRADTKDALQAAGKAGKVGGAVAAGTLGGAGATGSWGGVTGSWGDDEEDETPAIAGGEEEAPEEQAKVAPVTPGEPGKTGKPGSAGKVVAGLPEQINQAQDKLAALTKQLDDTSVRDAAEGYQKRMDQYALDFVGEKDKRRKQEKLEG